MNNMQSVTSISGGKTSAYLAKHFPTDHNVFALVRTSDKRCLFPDKKLRALVEDRIQKPFIGTLEDDTIIYTILDLEQFIGSKIDWVSGLTFDDVIKYKGGWLPNKLHRYCTQYMKLLPIFEWWYKNFNSPVEMSIGYRANEKRRVNKMNNRLNENGLIEIKATVRKHTNGQFKGKNKWEVFEWQKPGFPLFENQIYKDQIEKYWGSQNVRFADYNNCVGCFHRNPMFLKKMFELHENKMDWFANQEGGKNGYWRSDTTYKKIKGHNLQIELALEDFSDCDSGYCGI